MDDRRAVKNAYDEMDIGYAERVETKSMTEPVARFCDELGPKDELLDAGCGGGDPPLAVAGEKGVGLDFSRNQLHTARENTPANLVQGDMAALPFRMNSFDAIAAIYSLIHVPLHSHRTVIGEFARVLRPDGTLLVTEGGMEWTGSNANWLDSGREMRWSMAGPDATRDDLEACGFEIRRVWDVPDPTTEDSEKPFFLADLS